jgi:hypothetical protein
MWALLTFFFFGYRLEIEVFMNEKDKVVIEVSDEKWFRDWHYSVTIAITFLRFEYRTSRSRETYFSYVWSCQSF